jgi:hypothetical protein
VEANSTGGQGSRRAVAPSDGDDDDDDNSINSRQFNNFHQPRYNLSKYQRDSNTDTQNCGNLVYV